MPDKISTRQNQILELLLTHRDGMTIDEIANSLSISRNAVQQHFMTLENQGYIHSSSQKKTAGRPVRTYSLTEAGINYFPKQYGWFSELILTDLKKELGTHAFNQFMQKLATTLSENLLPKFKDKAIEHRVVELIKIMNTLGYQANSCFSTEKNDLQIMAVNCVYHDLAQQHQEICQFDITLISKLLGKEIELEECMAKGGHFCCFKIKKNRNDTPYH